MRKGIEHSLLVQGIRGYRRGIRYRQI